jgi:hypothetical protein
LQSNIFVNHSITSLFLKSSFETFVLLISEGIIG